MPALTINVPAAAVPILVAAADEMLLARGIDATGMTQVQKGQRYIAEILKDVVKSRTLADAEVGTVKAARDAAAAAAKVATDAITA